MANPYAPRWSSLVCILTLLIPALHADNSDKAGAAFATQDSLKQLTLEELSQIDVTSVSKGPAPAFKSPTAIFVITSDDIRRAGVTTLADALRMAPGVEVARIDGSKWSIGIRGFGSRLARSVLVLIDGRSVYTPLFAGTYWEVQDYLLEDVDRIEVIRGPGGTIWGPNAVNGVINIITKSSKNTRGAYASAGGGNLEQGFANFRYGSGPDDGLSYRFYAKAFDRGPEYHSDHDNFDAWRGAQAGFRMDWGSPGRDTFTVQGDMYTQEDGEREAVASYTPPMESTPDGYEDASGGNLLARWTHTVNSNTDFQIETYYDRTNHHEVNVGEDRDTFDVDVIAHTNVGTRQQFIYGFGAQSSDSHVMEVSNGLVFDPANRLDFYFSGFFEDDITLVDRHLTLDTGSKVFRTNFTGVEFEPSIRLSWTPNERNTVWAAYTHAIRAPSQVEHDFYLSSYLGVVDGLPLMGRYDANTQFAPEQLNGYEIGYRTLVGKHFFLDLATFANHYHDLFSIGLTSFLTPSNTLPFPSPVSPPDYLLISAQYRNDIDGTTIGGEIAPEWRPTDRWRLRGSYAYLNMNLSLRPGAPPSNPAQGTVGSSPRHQATAESSFDISKKLEVDLQYRFVSGLAALAVPSYSTASARIAWRFHPHLEFSVVGDNLLQPRHVEYVNDPGPPVAIIRNVYASLAWRK